MEEITKPLALFPLKDFRKNVVMRTYKFVVEGGHDEFGDETWELIFVDAESLDVAKIKAKEKAEAYGYKKEPDYIGIVQIENPSENKKKKHK